MATNIDIIPEKQIIFLGLYKGTKNSLTEVEQINHAAIFQDGCHFVTKTSLLCIENDRIIAY